MIKLLLSYLWLFSTIVTSTNRFLQDKNKFLYINWQANRYQKQFSRRLCKSVKMQHRIAKKKSFHGTCVKVYFSGKIWSPVAVVTRWRQSRSAHAYKQDWELPVKTGYCDAFRCAVQSAAQVSIYQRYQSTHFSPRRRSNSSACVFVLSLSFRSVIPICGIYFII